MLTNLLPSTVIMPGSDPTVVQTWFAKEIFSYPGPWGISVVQVAFSVWNSFVRMASKP
jgi:hypothetical protein